MQYGLIGEKLSHSYSKEIHESFGLYNYELKEIARENLEAFIKGREYLGLNVTIPYKEMVIPYLDEIDDGAKAIGAVNTIVNRDGKLFGYNTDFYGLKILLEGTGCVFENKTALVLGSGGTSKTATAVLEALSVSKIIHVSRSSRDGFVSYEDALRDYSDADYIVNTTPSGMYPNIDAQAIDLCGFKNLCAVFDVIFNPLRTKLMLQAEELGIKAFGGLKMLVFQAVVAGELFTGKSIDRELGNRIYKNIRKQNENIVLIGMPGTGKSTIGKLLSRDLDMEFCDTDQEIVKKEDREITDIFANDGEAYFRKIEEDIIGECSLKKHVVLSTGGGAILSDKNVRSLKAYGRLYFLNRNVESLVPTDDRPLANDILKMKRLYEERLPRYRAVSDVEIDGNKGIKAEVFDIKKDRDEL